MDLWYHAVYPWLLFRAQLPRQPGVRDLAVWSNLTPVVLCQSTFGHQKDCVDMDRSI